jgi:hypothetical protein
MIKTRQDAWTENEDQLLAEIVLLKIREGGTQLQAFEEVGRTLSRTAAACGFRWNAQVRKEYRKQIELAKKQRKEMTTKPLALNTKKLEQPIVKEESEKGSILIDYETLVEYIKSLYNKAFFSPIQNEKEKKAEEKIEILNEKINELISENEKISYKKSQIEKEYHALKEIIDSANKFISSAK